MTLLRADGIAVVRGGKTLLDGVDLTVEPGRLLAIAGPNGAGKSTLLSVLSGALSPTRGRVLLDGRPLDQHDVEGLARRRAVLRQRFSVTSDFTAAEIVRLGRTPYGSGERSLDSLVERLLEEVGLVGLASRTYATLSGGEQQRVQLARVLAQLEGGGSHSKLLFLDEPSSSLDPRHQHHVLSLVRSRVVERGYAAIAVVHDLGLVARYADEVLLLRDAKAVFSGPADQLEGGLLSEVFQIDVRRIDTKDGRPSLWLVDP